MKCLHGQIFIRRLRLHAHHGVMPQERVVGGEYTVSLCVTTDLSRAMESDDVEDTVDYSQLKSIIVSEMAIPSNLLEHVAGRIASHVCQTFPSVAEVEVEIVKLNPPMGGDSDGAGVVIHLINDKSL